MNTGESQFRREDAFTAGMGSTPGRRARRQPPRRHQPRTQPANTLVSADVNGHGELAQARSGDLPAGGHGLSPRTDMQIRVKALFEVDAHAPEDSPNEISLTRGAIGPPTRPGQHARLQPG